MSRSASQSLKRATVHIHGMHCANCEVLVGQKLKEIPGVLSAEVDYRKGTATIEAVSGKLPTFIQVRKAIEAGGYSIGTQRQPAHFGSMAVLETAGVIILLFALYWLLQTFNLVSLAPSTSGVLTYGGLLLIGLVAGTSSCLAVTGGLLLAIAANYGKNSSVKTRREKLWPLMLFNVGRLVSYFILGGVVGVIGKAITLNGTLTGYMNILVAFIMLYLGLRILNIIPKGYCPIRPPKFLSSLASRLSQSKNPLAPFILGASTFFLPCGFTQSLQIAALASGSFLSGALIMFFFALGTLPSLLGISLLSTLPTGRASRMFFRFSGTLVVLLSLLNINSGLYLIGVDAPGFIATKLGYAESIDVEQFTIPFVNGAQEISMRVTPTRFEPDQLVVKSGLPVRWFMDGTEAAGCTSVLVVPSLGIVKPLVAGENTVEFTPSAPGTIAFSCSMGTVHGNITVL